LGFKIDERDYSVAANFLQIFKTKQINIFTGNPEKIHSLIKSGFEVSTIQKIKKGKKFTKRQLIELTEKIGRGYEYPELEFLNNTKLKKYKL
jgi:GTP cyclohydrolase II